MGHDSYFKYINKLYETKRDFLTRALKEARLSPMVAEAGFFIMADPNVHEFPESFSNSNGSSPVSRAWAFSRLLYLFAAFFALLVCSIGI